MRNLIKRELRPFNSLATFDQFFNNNAAGFWPYDSMMEMPAFNIIEEKDQYIIELAVPGLNKDDFQIEIKDQLLTIKVEKEQSTESEENESKYIKREFSFHQFSRSFTLDKNISKDDIEASYENGVLIVNLKKISNPEIVKKIEIK
ncbi:MAG: Hsp20/alpha crystallin family protein [Saprospiraceae bacterium]|nr:Hsp20/alpha crystallin family protein [Saprospiraceae bacterium]